ncbi:ICP22 family protein [Mycolicibacterium palauense]|uniref:hypothetical protein n=1 Tax=Mycolicibacterium palauense TaxID=2034511 RepID=UPI000BFEF2C4|nr:hypothetical protein [Mycolicibacterium palauense]
MRRWIAVLWHLSSLLLAAALYFLFVLPRWWELTGDISHTLGTAMRIACGVLVGLTALPVVFTLLKSRRPEFGTPRLALSLRVWSIVAHVLAGLLILGTAIAEIWVSLDDAGQILFACYGAAAAIAVLGALAFYLAYVAEMPPPPPKPLKPKTEKKRGRKRDAEHAAEEDAHEATKEDTEDTTEDTEPAEPAAGEPVAGADASAGDEADGQDQDGLEDGAPGPDDTDEPKDTDEPEDADEPAEPEGAESASGRRLRNRRPRGKGRGAPGGVAVSED